MASFVVTFNFSPKDYYEMTVGERSAIVEAHAKANKRR
jgi:hypothetical protein